MKNTPKALKRILYVLLCLTVLLSCFIVTAFTTEGDVCANDEGGAYSNGFCPACSNHYEPAVLNANGCYEISNAGQLYWFAELVNAGANEYSGSNGGVYNAVLTADIVVNAQVLDENGELVRDTRNLRAWTPIGCSASYNKFVCYSGTFDGQGHTISGLYYNDASASGVGLFGYVDSDGTVQNVGLVNSYFSAEEEIGAVAGKSKGAVTGCWNNASRIVGIGNQVGGVVGCSDNGIISGCYNQNGSVTGEAYVGGVVGTSSNRISDSYNTGTVTGSYQVGGVVGESNRESADSYAYVTNCYNTGKVSGGYYIGGVVGCGTYSVTSNCYNAGDVGGSSSLETDGGAGGVIGVTSSGCTTENCYNTGSVSSDFRATGGIIGKNAGTLSNSYNIGSVTTTYTNSNNKGNCVGAVVGWNTSGTVSGCHYLSGCAVDGNSLSQNGIGSFSSDTAVDSANVTTAHTYGKPAFVWHESELAAEAVFSCGDCAEGADGHTCTVAAVVKKSVSAFGDCKTKGTITYTASVANYSDEKTVEGTLGTHPDDGSTEHICRLCGATLSECVDADGDNKCDICGEGMKSDETKPNETKPNETNPGETEPGYTVPECDGGGDCVMAKFPDLVLTEWYHDGVHFCIEEELMNGMDTGDFQPGGNTTRAQLVTILYREAGSPDVSDVTEPFSDVVDSDWFYKAVVWAYNNGVVNGTSDTTFSPNDNVTREQVATILYRYSGSPMGTGDLSVFPDVNTVSAYAVPALTWAVGEGLINGVAKDGVSTLDPTGNATRAQIATILMRYLTAE